MERDHTSKAKVREKIIHEMRLMLNIIEFYGFKGVFLGSLTKNGEL